MSTGAPEAVRWLADQWENGMDYSSAVLSGIVGDANHDNGYHISIDDNPSGDYSVVRPDDAAPPGGWHQGMACAIDMSMSTADMTKCHGRLCTVWRNRGSDSRARYVNAHNGWDGDNGAGRYDWYSGEISSASSDHKWHIHLEIRRRYWNDYDAMSAIATILSAGVAPSPPDPQPPSGDAPPWPFGSDDYLGRPSSDPHCHSGYYSDGDAAAVRTWQQRMADRGWSLTVDGMFGERTEDVCIQFQIEKCLDVDGLVGPQTWEAAWATPVT